MRKQQRKSLESPDDMVILGESRADFDQLEGGDNESDAFLDQKDKRVDPSGTGGSQIDRDISASDARPPLNPRPISGLGVSQRLVTPT